MVQLSCNRVTNFGALELLRTIKGNINSAVVEVDISVSSVDHTDVKI